MASEIKVDTISEKTSANGVTIDSVSLKDGKVATANSIDSDAYVDGSIDNAHIADDAIDSEHYADGSIDNAHIADDAIDSEHYAAGSIDTAHIADDQVTLAKMAAGTDGNIISYDASGNPVAIATGNDGQVLTSAGAGQPPAFEAAGGGKVLQVLQDTLLSTTSTTATAFEDIAGLTIDITPAATSSKILVMVQLSSFNSGANLWFSLVRDSTEVFLGDAASSRIRITTGASGTTTTGARAQQNSAIIYLDSPSSTSALTYKVQFRVSESATAYINRTANDTDSTTYPRAASSITVMEIGA